MQKLQEKYNISEVFHKRYFEQNALNRMAMEMLKFMWFKEGTFINPMKNTLLHHTQYWYSICFGFIISYNAFHRNDLFFVHVII